jgi:hypothetical protein
MYQKKPLPAGKAEKGQLITWPRGGSLEYCRRNLQRDLGSKSTTNSRLLPAITSSRVLGRRNRRIVDEDVYLRAVTNELVRKC